MPNEQFVDEDSAALTGAVSGASAGAVAGPGGAAVGAVIGAGIGIFQASAQNEALNKAQRNRNEALYKASILKNLAGQQSRSLRSTGRNLDAANPEASSAALPAGSTPTAQAAPKSVVGSNISAGTF